MSISFTCDCGKKMLAKDEFAGRRLRCPECQRVVAIPAMNKSAAAPKAGPNPAAQIAPPPPKATLAKPVPKPLTDTPPPSKTIPAAAPLFTPPVAKPLLATPPLKSAVPIAATVALSVTQPIPEPAKHPWCDTSLSQSSTPWRIGDERIFQADVPLAYEWAFPWVPAVSAAAVFVYFMLAIAGP